MISNSGKVKSKLTSSVSITRVVAGNLKYWNLNLFQYQIKNLYHIKYISFFILFRLLNSAKNTI